MECVNDNYTMSRRSDQIISKSMVNIKKKFNVNFNKKNIVFGSRQYDINIIVEKLI